MIDVRAPIEFNEGHVLFAHNLPLFSDDERAEIGTLYKQVGKEEAILQGLSLVGPKMRSFVEEAKKIAPDRNILIHCARGGMRSSSMAWLFSTIGMRVALLKGGYKAYRQHLRNSFSLPIKFIVLGGMTGVGKTDLLHALRDRGHQTLDLEAYANHMGSAFGGLGRTQPTNEQFENNLFHAWMGLDFERVVIVEDESRHIGRVQLPDQVYNALCAAPIIHLKLSKELRIARLVRDYSEMPKELLVSAFKSIETRLGGAATKSAIKAVLEGDFHAASDMALYYYDKSYTFSLEKKTSRDEMECDLGTLPFDQMVDKVEGVIRGKNS